jgi:periplasmic divalent cation tolerance protein
MNYSIIFSTAPSEDEAAKIAKALVEKKLVAGVNIVPKIRSIYSWKGKLCDETEAMLIMKTRTELIDKIKTELKALHSYECPELIAVPISDGLKDYLNWIDESSIHF